MDNQVNLSVNQFCAAVPCGRTKAYELIGSGEIRAIKLGRKTLIPKTELERLQAKLPSIQPRTRGPPAKQSSDVVRGQQLEASSTTERGGRDEHLQMKTPTLQAKPKEE
jgi:excisionase family DNA binding protein